MTTSESRNWKLVSNGTACAVWEERLRSLPTIAKSTGTAMFLSYSENSKLGSGSTKGAIQVAPRRKEIAYDHLRIQELESLGLSGAFE
jgi:hypothetical protein